MSCGATDKVFGHLLYSLKADTSKMVGIQKSLKQALSPSPLSKWRVTPAGDLQHCDFVKLVDVQKHFKTVCRVLKRIFDVSVVETRVRQADDLCSTLQSLTGDGHKTMKQLFSHLRQASLSEEKIAFDLSRILKEVDEALAGQNLPPSEFQALLKQVDDDIPAGALDRFMEDGNTASSVDPATLLRLQQAILHAYDVNIFLAPEEASRTVVSKIWKLTFDLLCNYDTHSNETLLDKLRECFTP